MDRSEVALSVEALSVTKRNRPLVRAAHFTLCRGELVALLGPNGAGKTSLLRALLGLLHPCEGRILIFGKPLDQLSTLQRARQLAYVPQQSELDTDLSVHDVVAMGRYAHRGEFSALTEGDTSIVRDACARTDVMHLVERSMRTLSGGERHRVLLARALATQAPIILLDEPTTSLDILHTLTCLQHLQALAAEGQAILWVTHDLQHAHDFAERVLLMNEGRIIADGPTHEVLVDSRCQPTFGVSLVPGGALGYRHADVPEPPDA